MNEIRDVAIIGAGVMGHGIGLELARAGYRVTLYRRTKQGIEEALASVHRSLAELVDWGPVTEGEKDEILGRIRGTTSLEDAAAGADLAIEAVPENLELKQQIFRQLDRLCPKHAILASNTSSLMPTTLAAVTHRPERVLVAHFSYPPHLIPLVEIVRGEGTSDATVTAVYDAVKRAGKSPIIIQKEVMGFIINRLQVALQREALHLVARGVATAQDVDIAVKQSFGRRLGVVGPIEMVEVQDGWDITRQIHEYILPDLDDSKSPSPAILERVQQKELGPKTGRGFYNWTPETVQAWTRRLNAALARFLFRAD